MQSKNKASTQRLKKTILDWQRALYQIAQHQPPIIFRLSKITNRPTLYSRLLKRVLSGSFPLPLTTISNEVYKPDHLEEYINNSPLSTHCSHLPLTQIKIVLLQYHKKTSIVILLRGKLTNTDDIFLTHIIIKIKINSNL